MNECELFTNRTSTSTTLLLHVTFSLQVRWKDSLSDRNDTGQQTHMINNRGYLKIKKPLETSRRKMVLGSYLTFTWEKVSPIFHCLFHTLDPPFSINPSVDGQKKVKYLQWGPDLQAGAGPDFLNWGALTKSPTDAGGMNWKMMTKTMIKITLD